MQKPVVLIIEDDPDNARSVAEVAEDAGFKAVVTLNGNQGVESFQLTSPDLVLCDLVLPDIDGIEVLKQLTNINPQVPVIIMTAYASVDSGVTAIRIGAYDYITKPLDLDDIQSKMKRACEASKLRQQVHSLTRSMRERYAVKNISAESNSMKSVIAQIEALADTTATILISGESGTGKELVARALHADSRRSDQPFVAVNCGAFAESLLESELFGHEKGAFTGATTTHKGAFERADGGTLFLDEIGDAPMSVQVKLLRALEEREIRRVGGRESFKVNIRLVSATNQKLEELIEQGKFREDLYYRLNVINLRIPPLRERKADIRHLTDRFLTIVAHENERKINSVSLEFYQALEAFNWPGNVRQLRNVIESAVLLTPDGNLTATSVNLPPYNNSTSNTSLDPGVPHLTADMTLAEIERAVLHERLLLNKGNRTTTAAQLGLSRRTIQRKIQEHNLLF